VPETSFVEKLLTFQFILGTGNFGADGQTTVDLGKLRASVHIEQAGGMTMPVAHMRIYGMTQSMMNKLCTLGQIATTVRRNTVVVQAGVTGGVMSEVFRGTIQNAYGDYSSMPEVPFVVDVYTGLDTALKPSSPTSIKGNADVAMMLSGLASQMGLTFENNGVTAKLSNPSYQGSAWSQAQQIVQHAGIEWNSGQGGILAIWNPGQSRATQIPKISPKTGMIGYPTYFSLGIAFRMLFSTSVMFGGRVEVESSLPAASGSNWIVCNLSADLETITPHGRWELSVQCTPVGYGNVAPSR
jgi:hypothetical protein